MLFLSLCACVHCSSECIIVHLYNFVLVYGLYVCVHVCVCVYVCVCTCVCVCVWMGKERHVIVLWHRCKLLSFGGGGGVEAALNPSAYQCFCVSDTVSLSLKTALTCDMHSFLSFERCHVVWTFCFVIITKTDVGCIKHFTVCHKTLFGMGVPFLALF